MNLKKVLCIIMCIFFVSLSGCTDKSDNENDLPDSDISTTQADMSEFLNKEYTPSDKVILMAPMCGKVLLMTI